MTLYRPASEDDFRFSGVSGHIVHCAHACHCSCHRTPGIMHIMACCTICPRCRGFVNNLDAHPKKCHHNHDVSFKNIGP